MTSLVGKYWKEYFYELEDAHGLQTDNINHKWLLQHLFLPKLNEDLKRFTLAWNDHPIGIKGSPDRSPNDMFFFDSFTHGFRGDDLPADCEPTPPHNEEPHPMALEDAYALGIDWAEIPHSIGNNVLVPTWSGRGGPPSHLNAVTVDTPTSALSPEALQYLDALVQPWQGTLSSAAVVNIWRNALAFARLQNPFAF